MSPANRRSETEQQVLLPDPRPFFGLTEHDSIDKLERLSTYYVQTESQPLPVDEESEHPALAVGVGLWLPATQDNSFVLQAAGANESSIKALFQTILRTNEIILENQRAQTEQHRTMVLEIHALREQVKQQASYSSPIPSQLSSTSAEPSDSLTRLSRTTTLSASSVSTEGVAVKTETAVRLVTADTVEEYRELTGIAVSSDVLWTLQEAKEAYCRSQGLTKLKSGSTVPVEFIIRNRDGIQVINKKGTGIGRLEDMREQVRMALTDIENAEYADLEQLAREKRLTEDSGKMKSKGSRRKELQKIYEDLWRKYEELRLGQPHYKAEIMCGQRLRSIAGIKRKKHRILYAQQTGVKLEEPGEGEEEEELQEYEAVAPAKRLLTDRRRDEIKETTSSVATGMRDGAAASKRPKVSNAKKAQSLQARLLAGVKAGDKSRRGTDTTGPSQPPSASRRSEAVPSSQPSPVFSSTSTQSPAGGSASLTPRPSSPPSLPRSQAGVSGLTPLADSLRVHDTTRTAATVGPTGTQVGTAVSATQPRQGLDADVGHNPYTMTSTTKTAPAPTPVAQRPDNAHAAPPPPTLGHGAVGRTSLPPMSMSLGNGRLPGYTTSPAGQNPSNGVSRVPQFFTDRITGKRTDAHGRQVNEYGQYIDQYGRLINDRGELVDNYGRLVDADGRIIHVGAGLTVSAGQTGGR
ncbi:hypothetical protein V8E36_008287 [Tilletia maclaganii]